MTDVWKTRFLAQYWGESSRTGYLRGKEHWANHNKKTDDSPLHKHDLIHHQGVKGNYHMKILQKHNKPLDRQMHEATLIECSKANILMNSKGEYHGARVPRVVVEMGARTLTQEYSGTPSTTQTFPTKTSKKTTHPPGSPASPTPEEEEVLLEIQEWEEDIRNWEQQVRDTARTQRTLKPTKRTQESKDCNDNSSQEPSNANKRQKMTPGQEHNTLHPTNTTITHNITSTNSNITTTTPNNTHNTHSVHQTTTTPPTTTASHSTTQQPPPQRNEVPYPRNNSQRPPPPLQQMSQLLQQIPSKKIKTSLPRQHAPPPTE